MLIEVAEMSCRNHTELCEEHRADARAVVRADIGAEVLSDTYEVSRAVVRADLRAVVCAELLQ